MTYRLGLQSERGVTLIETMLVVGIMGVLATMAVLQFTAAQPAMKGDSAMRVILGQMRLARELAISERRYMRVVFDNPNEMQILREEVPGPATTVKSTIVLEGGVSYSVVGSVPDTPDAFGKSTAIYFGGVANVKFSPDGTLVNQDGATANGTVFLAIPNVSQSARAVTVLGSTGRIRGYRWDGRAWKVV
jgi:prepilin-type N-terminal cleavage/methylation domain-containing protein